MRAGINRLSNNAGKSDNSLPPMTGKGQGGGDKIDIKSILYIFTLPLILSSPSRRLYPPACKPYGLETEPEAVKEGKTSCWTDCKVRHFN
jgi:hypothetical protein